MTRLSLRGVFSSRRSCARSDGMVLARRSRDEPGAAAPTHDPRQLKRRKDKVRSAWISFVGRIVAQIVGAVASVLLGFMVLTKYGLPERAPAKTAAASSARVRARPVRDRTPRPSGELALAVLPMQNFSKRRGGRLRRRRCDGSAHHRAGADRRAACHVPDIVDGVQGHVEAAAGDRARAGCRSDPRGIGGARPRRRCASRRS